MINDWKSSLDPTPKKPAIANSANPNILFDVSSSANLHEFNEHILNEDSVDINAINRANSKRVAQKAQAANYALHMNRMDFEDPTEAPGIHKAASLSTMGAGADIVMASGFNAYSPWLSTDYLELPRSFAEERRWYRHFYDVDPYIGRAVDLKTYIPLSKVNLSIPKAKNHAFSQKVMAYFQDTWKTLKLHRKLIEIVHEYHLIGEVIPYFEWDPTTKKYVRATLLDPDLCEVVQSPLLDETRIYLRLDNSIRDSIERMRMTNRYSALADTLDEISSSADPYSSFQDDMDSNYIELNTDPSKGSYAVYFSKRRSPYKPDRGVSILRRLLRDLLFRDKIRQSQTQIVSRLMTPVHLVSADTLDEDSLDQLRTQVDMAIMGPDHTIVTNFPVTWEEKTPEGRLYDSAAIIEQTNENLLIGLGLTKELLTGEGSYGGGRISLQVLDLEFALLRDLIQEMMDDLFRTAAEKNGFFETDEDTGLTYTVYSTLKFNRLSLRDYSDVYDFLWNMYQAGTVDDGAILEFMNFDPVDVAHKKRDNMFTLRDNTMDEFKRAVYSELVPMMLAETNLKEIFMKGMGFSPIEVKPPADEGFADEPGAYMGGDLEEMSIPEETPVEETPPEEAPAEENLDASPYSDSPAYATAETPIEPVPLPPITQEPTGLPPSPAGGPSGPRLPNT